jgi:TPR repeat protein
LPAKSPKENSVPPPSAPQPAGESAATPNSIRAEQPDISAKQATGESGKGEANDVGNAGVSSPDKTGNAAANPIPEKAAPQKGISATGQAEFEEARKILRGNHRQRDMEKAVELLLAGVSRGNVRAEVTLGDLYARGDGVPKDCGQARTLLEAAVKRGSPEARQFLGKLKSEGCP